MGVDGFDTDFTTFNDLPPRFSGHLQPSKYHEKCTKDGTTTSGAWCLEHKTPPLMVNLKHSSYELPKNHGRADIGIVRFLSTLLLAQNTILDLGAGVGQYGRELIDANRTWSGQYQAIDGAVNVEDFTDGFVKSVDLGVTQELPVADWVMSLEVGEHILHRMEDYYVHNLHASNRKGILLSWGVLNQPGFHHINNHSPGYIIKRFTRLGYAYDKATSFELRSNASYPWFKHSIYIFRR